MKKYRNKWMSAILAIVMVLSLLPGTALALSPGLVTVRIVGENSVLLDTTVNVDAVTDYTTDAGDSSTGINALDAVIYAALQNGYDANSYHISYSSQYGSYYLSEIAGITPSNSDYWGSLAVSSSDRYEGGALSTHAAASGDTYIVYYDKYTGASLNYGYQSCAWFTKDAVSGTAGSVTALEVKTTGYDANYNTVSAPLSGTTIYASGPDFASPTPVAVTDSSGKAYITFSGPGTYTLTLSSDYTFAQCEVTVTGTGVTLSDLSIHVTGGTSSLTNTALTLTNGSGSTVSPYEISPGTYNYRLPDGTYSYQVSSAGYEPSSGTITVNGPTSESIPITVMTGYKVTITPGDAAEETVAVKDSSGAKQSAISSVGGAYIYDLKNGSYTYTVSRSGYHSFFGSFTVSGADQDIKANSLQNTAANTADWPSFRDPTGNMAIVSCETAKGSWQANEKWSTSLGSLGFYGTLSASNIVLYDGYLYVATEHGLAKIDKSTGKLLTTAALSTDTSYVTQIAYGDGKIFVTTASGIDAFDALTMELAWSAPISAYGNYMASTPILYDDTSKTLYVGDYGDSNYTLGTYGGYSAINAADGTSKWILYGGETDARYWAGAVIVGDYVVFGSDSGTLTSVKKDASGCASAAGTLSVTGKIHSSIAYDGAYLYFTTSSGYICKASIDSGTGQLTAVSARQFTTGSSSTPVVNGGRIYVGAGDGIYVLNADDLSQISHYKANGSVQSSALLTTAYGGTTYAYFADNSPQGEIIVLSDDGTNVSYDTLYIPSQNQYSLSSLIADSDGTIYYTNDSGYIFAIQNNHQANADKVKTAISVSPSSVYHSGTFTTEYPTITVKDSGGSVVSTAAAGTYYLAAGNYTYTVSLSGYTTSTGSFTVAVEDIAGTGITIPVSLSEPSPTPSTITVTVSVIGNNSNVWVNGDSITVPKGSSAWTAIKKALDNSGLSYVTNESSLGIYISSVNGLAEFNQGPNSGWKYLINGTAPGVGISSYTLSDSDQITLHYTNDYTKDQDSSSGTSPQSSAKADVTATLNQSTGVASAALSGTALNEFNRNITAGSDADGAEAVISVSLPVGAAAMNLSIPQSAVNALGNTDHMSLCIQSDFLSLKFDSKAIDQISSLIGGNPLSISVSKGDSSDLSDQEKAFIGTKPVYRFSVTVGNADITKFGEGRVTVSIPYTLGTDEDQNAVVVYYIDPSGTLQSVRSTYNVQTGTVDFTVSHFSEYAVGYHKVSFIDAKDTAWYFDAVTFCAARGITNGTGNHMFTPENILTRGQSIVLLMRAYGIEPDENPTDNFSDAGNAYYTNYLAAAKRLGISSGVGGNKFMPDSGITRQELFTLLYRMLNIIGELPHGASGKNLSNYTDAGEISDYAKIPMKALVMRGAINGTNGKLVPNGSTTRAQAVQVLYNLLSL